MKALPAPEIPQRIEDLTPEWLTGALHASGFVSRARVVSCESERLGEGEGFVGQIVRLRLGFDRSEAGAPASVIAKLPIRLDQNRQLGEALGAYDREIRFYTELADRVPIAKPVCYHAAMDPNPAAGREQENLAFLDRLPRWIVRILVPLGLWLASKSRRRYLLLLEDLAPSRRLGDQVEGCSRDEAEAVLRHIADVHAAWWQHADLGSLAWLPPVFTLPRFLEVAYRRARAPFRAHFGASVSTRFAEFADWLDEAGTPLVRRLARLPETLVHGDYRLDNLFFSGAGRETRVTAFDWQNVGRGPGVLDVAYFITGNLDADLALRCEQELLESYHRSLCEQGVRGYDVPDCVRDYERMKLFIGYRLIAGAEMIDFSDTRGSALIRAWLQRLDALLPRDWAGLMADPTVPAVHPLPSRRSPT
jgi:hypothetical protein